MPLVYILYIYYIISRKDIYRQYIKGVILVLGKAVAIKTVNIT